MTAPPTLDRSQQRRRSERAATTYAAAAVAQQEIGRRLLERFDFMRLTPKIIVDVGCGPGTHCDALAARYPESMVVALDHSSAMIRQAVGRRDGASGKGWLRRLIGRDDRSPSAGPFGVVADMHHLPVARERCDVLWSNFALQYSDDLPSLFAEWNRTLSIGGVLMFALPGPDTLRELRRAIDLAGDDATRRVRQFIDLHDIGDMLIDAGFADPVMDMEVLTLEYASADALWRDLKATGATNVLSTRARGLTTPRRLRAFAAALDAGRVAGAPIRVTIEVIYGHAWKLQRPKTREGFSVVRLEDIRRGSRRAPPS